MTLMQEQAMELLQQLPDDKIQAIITLATDEIKLMQYGEMQHIEKKKAAFAALDGLNLQLPVDFDPAKELADALEEKYDPAC